MEKLKLIIALLAMCITNIYAQQSFSGYWMCITETSKFRINMLQTGDIIKGGICATMDNGNFIDCSMYETTDEDIVDGYPLYSVKGIVDGNIATVDFFSTYASAWGIDTAWGKATITKINDTHIKWQITVRPSGGVCFIPEEAILTNQGGEE